MSHDEIVRRAALLLRSGAVPVSEFVGALDDATAVLSFASIRHRLSVGPKAGSESEWCFSAYGEGSGCGCPFCKRPERIAARKNAEAIRMAMAEDRDNNERRGWVNTGNGAGDEFGGSDYP